MKNIIVYYRCIFLLEWNPFLKCNMAVHFDYDDETCLSSKVHIYIDIYICALYR